MMREADNSLADWATHSPPRIRERGSVCDAGVPGAGHGCGGAALLARRADHHSLPAASRLLPAAA